MAGPGQDHAFVREEVFPSWFANRVQDMLSAGKFDLVLSRKNATTIQVVPDAILGIAAVNIKGRWRFNTATVERVVTGAKATYGIWAVAEDNSINNTPNPFTDHTVYTFELRVSATEPAVGAGTAIATKIGEVDWSGTEIETIRQNRGAVTGAQIADGALSSAGTDIEWKREANGALVPTVKATAINTEKLANLAVTEGKLDAALQAKLGLTAQLAKGANQTLATESTALQEITGLSIPIGASATEQWLVEYFLLIEGASAVDIKVGFTGPTGATMQWGAGTTWTDAALAAEPSAVLPIGTALERGVRNAAVTALRVTGIVFGGGTAGNLVVKAANQQGVGVGSKILKGSTALGRKTAL